MSNKKQVAGIWIPENETHLIGTLQNTAIKSGGKGSYQLATLGAMLDYVPAERRRRFVDVGAHVGLWSMHLAKRFDQVVSFEPVPLFRECFLLNVQAPNVDLRPYALGDVNSSFDMSVEPDNSGHTHILPDDPNKHIPNAELVHVEMKRLDDETFDVIDAMKIDVEGFEPAVLMGAEQTLKHHKPVICVEQKPHGFYNWDQFYAARLLMMWGAKPVQRVVDDYIFIWE